MKKLITLLLILALLVGCAQTVETNQNIEDVSYTSFYYQIPSDELLSGEEVIQAEHRINVETESFDLFFSSYFSGPNSNKLISPFPYGTRVSGVSVSDDMIQLQLSDEFFSLHGIDFSVACGCLARTVYDCFGFESLVITDAMERYRITLYPTQYLVDYPMGGEKETVFTLYFPDENGRYLQPETREVILSPNESSIDYLLHELKGGPIRGGSWLDLPESMHVIDFSIERKVCTVNFSSELMELDKYPHTAYLFVYCIVNTITGVDGIDYVSFLCEGKPITTLGRMVLQNPLARNNDAINSVNNSAGRIDVDLFVLDQEELLPFSLPYCARREMSEPLAQTVAQAAVSFEPPAGMVNPIPYATEILSVSVSAETCYLDVSSKIIPVNDTLATEQHILWSLVSAITALDGIDAVILTVEGEPSGFRYIDISVPMTFDRVQLFV